MILKSIVVLLACCLLNNYPLVAQTSAEKDVADRVETLRKAMIKPDQVILEDLAAEELNYVHSSGTVRDKVGFVDEFVKGWSVFTAITLQNQTITIAGDNAIVRHRLLADTNKENMPPKIDIIILMVWKKQHDKWKLLARQAAKIPVN